MFGVLPAEIVGEAFVVGTEMGKAGQDLREFVMDVGHIGEFAGVKTFMFERQVECEKISLADQVPGDIGAAVDEFSSEFDGDFQFRVANSVDSAADSVAGLEDQNPAVVGGENVRGGQAGSAGAEDDYFRVHGWDYPSGVG